MSFDLIKAIALIKKCAAIVNTNSKKLDVQKSKLIIKICDQILNNNYLDQFPLSIWQTGSGTQTNMNVNEVIANLANQIAKAKIIHPNDHVNMSQSSNDVFPTAMHITGVLLLKSKLLSSLEKIIQTLIKLEKETDKIIKVGRTHLQDATPIKLSQEISG
jgi:fumarate hydratase class II